MGVTSYLTIDGEILSETRSGIESDYIPDPLGSTAALINSSQTITDTFSWWPFGESRSHTGSSITPFGYGGTLGYHADSSGRVFVYVRVVQTAITSWQTVDPVWPVEPAFAYANCSPVSKSDPSGLIPSPGCRRTTTSSSPPRRAIAS